MIPVDVARGGGAGFHPASVTPGICEISIFLTPSYTMKKEKENKQNKIREEG